MTHVGVGARPIRFIRVGLLLCPILTQSIRPLPMTATARSGSPIIADRRIGIPIGVCVCSECPLTIERRTRSLGPFHQPDIRIIRADIHRIIAPIKLRKLIIRIGKELRIGASGCNDHRAARSRIARLKPRRWRPLPRPRRSSSGITGLSTPPEQGCKHTQAEESNHDL